MSLINQVLKDLEERRASVRERSGLPDHVRALPAPRSAPAMTFIAAAFGALVVVAAGVWYATTRPAVPVAPAAPPAAVAPPPVVTTPVAQPVAADAPSAESVTWSGIASRMTLELMSAPELPPPAPARPRDPIAASKVVGKTAPSASGTVPDSSRGALQTAAREPQKALTPADVARADASNDIEKQVRPPTAQQIADNHYARAGAFMHHNRLAEAREGYEAAVRAYPAHAAARQALAGLMINAKQLGEAEKLLQEGLRIDPRQTGFAMTVARIQVDTGAIDNAIDTLQRSVAYAQDQADYLGLLAALLQRRQRHAEAIEQFQAALRLKPQNGLWLVATGVSLQALGRPSEARDYFRRAQAVGGLNADVQAYVEQRLRQTP